MTVKGKDVYFYVNDAGDLKPICCARTASLTTAADIGETSTLGTGKWKTFKGLKLSYSLSAGGLVSFDMNESIMALRNLQFNLAPVGFSFFGTDDNGHQETYTGSFLITSIGTPTSYNSTFEYSVEGQGTGALTTQMTVLNTFKIYYGTQANNSDPTDFTKLMVKNAAREIQVNYGTITTPKFYWMAHSKDASQKGNWTDLNDTGNAGSMGNPGDLFDIRSIVINGLDYWLYMSHYATDFTGNDSKVKFY